MDTINKILAEKVMKWVFEPGFVCPAHAHEIWMDCKCKPAGWRDPSLKDDPRANYGVTLEDKWHPCKNPAQFQVCWDKLDKDQKTKVVLAWTPTDSWDERVRSLDAIVAWQNAPLEEKAHAMSVVFSR